MSSSASAWPRFSRSRSPLRRRPSRRRACAFPRPARSDRTCFVQYYVDRDPSPGAQGLPLRHAELRRTRRHRHPGPHAGGPETRRRRAGGCRWPGPAREGRRAGHLRQGRGTGAGRGDRMRQRRGHRPCGRPGDPVLPHGARQRGREAGRNRRGRAADRTDRPVGRDRVPASSLHRAPERPGRGPLRPRGRAGRAAPGRRSGTRPPPARSPTPPVPCSTRASRPAP